MTPHTVIYKPRTYPPGTLVLDVTYYDGIYSLVLGELGSEWVTLVILDTDQDPGTQYPPGTLNPSPNLLEVAEPEEWR